MFKFQTNTYQALLFTNGRTTGIVMLFQEDSMNWNWNSKANSARIGYSHPNARRNIFPDDSFSTRAISYRPDDLIGTSGLRGQYVFQLDSNDHYYVNPRAYCLNWYNQESSFPYWSRQFRTNPCPCSVWQAIFDPRYTSCSYTNYIPNPYNPYRYTYTYPYCESNACRYN